MKEKFKKIPRNYVVGVEYERVIDYNHNMISSFGRINEPSSYFERSMQTLINAKVTMRIEIRDDEDAKILQLLQAHGLGALVDKGLSLDKFKFVMNQGYTRLPALLKHPDPEIAELAFILSKYFACRSEIMPDEIIE